MFTNAFNIRHMRALCDAVKLSSVSAAAQKNNLSQAAVSQGLASLETEVGTPLFVRTKTGIAATQCGEIFARRASTALDLHQRGARAALREAGVESKNTRIDRHVTAAQLRALVNVAKFGSFTVAANELGLAQPTVYRSARTLEQTCGFPLFLSTKSGVEVTAAGRIFLRHIKLANDEIRQCLEEISAQTGERHSSFILGTLPLARSQIVPHAVDALIKTEPHSQVSIVDGLYAELLRALREGEIDCLIGALRNPAPADDVIEERLFTDRMALVCGPHHPLTKKPSITLKDAHQYPWVAPPKPTPAGQYLFRTLRIEEWEHTPVRVVSSSLAVLRGLLNRGDYVTIVSRHQIEKDIELGLLVELPVALKDSERNIGLTTRRNWRPTASQKSFIGFLHEAVRQNMPEDSNK